MAATSAARPVPRPGSDGTPTARSVVVSILLPLERPELPVGALVRCCELFGIAEGTTRVALSRMVSAGELEAADGTYRLSGPMLARQHRQRAARHPALVPWDGRWLLGMLMAERRPGADRVAFRQQMAAHRMGEVRPGVWARPDNLAGLRSALEDDPVVGAGRCLWWSAELAGLGADREGADVADAGALARRLWDLDGWASAARALLADLQATLPGLQDGDVAMLAPCFTVAAAAVRHITHDPLLPVELLPEGWPGDALRAAYDAYEHAYGRTLSAWLAEDQRR
jgi:phenylacetic acid degradation operon negative regulatory protein